MVRIPACLFGLTVNNNTGVISGTPTATGAFIAAINANNAAGSGQADLVLTIDPVFGALPGQPSNLLNISTRLNVLDGDNVLIGGFIVTGTDPKQVLVRGIGPSLEAFGIDGALGRSGLGTTPGRRKRRDERQLESYPAVGHCCDRFGADR